MPTATLTSKCQMILPKPIRDHLKVHPGDQVDFIIRENGEVVLRPATLHLRDVFGLLHRPGQKPVSPAQMDRAIRKRAQEWA